MVKESIATELNYPSKYVDVLGSKIHYVEVGEGAPILFLHGIPTSCYLWRNVIPYVESLGRCIAPDLIGFGKSEKPAIEYSIFDHIKYIDKFIEALGLKQITLVMHGWGSLIGFNYAVKHAKNCKGIVFYEAFLHTDNGAEISLPYQEQIMISEAEINSYDLAANGVTYVDKIIPQHVMRHLTTAEMDHYRKPFLEAGTGRPIQQYLQELPRGSDETKVEKLIADYSRALTKSTLPKLMLYSVPGFITTIGTVMWAKENLPNLEIIDIGEELHLGQESNPKLIGESISVWLQGVEQQY